MQAIQRAHRIGQTRAVEAIRFCTIDSIEDNSKQLLPCCIDRRFTHLTEDSPGCCCLDATALRIVTRSSDGTASKEATSLRGCGGWQVQCDGL